MDWQLVKKKLEASREKLKLSPDQTDEAIALIDKKIQEENDRT
jgi:hypothetical protein